MQQTPKVGFLTTGFYYFLHNINTTALQNICHEILLR